ncbi:hypothetical protein ACFV42_46515 [Streptomyces solisilvae]|uniref:hypothetical protein n=1 Tax=Streptomyces malaysiensis TaxID=92644 RepID=UPI0036C79931
MNAPRPRALIETDPATGDLCVHLRGKDLRAPAPRVAVDGYTGTVHRDDPPLTPDQWAHLERACAQRCGASALQPAEVRGRAMDTRESAAMALAHRGYATMWRVRVDGDCAGWAIAPTQSGRAALRARLAAGTGDPATQEPTA